MPKSKITGHMLVKNEDIFVWYAVSSVLPYLDKLIIYDTGSYDRTVDVIKSINSPKIELKIIKADSPKKITELRNRQIKETRTDWIWIVDGDEIYPKRVAEIINRHISDDLLGIILHRYDLLGDIYHCQKETVGKYDQFGKTGHYVLRLINRKKIGNLKVIGDYPLEYYADENDRNIKMFGKKYFPIIEERIWHASYLRRSSMNNTETRTFNRNKFKIDKGLKIPLEQLPEIFSGEKPLLVPVVTSERGITYEFLSSIISPIKDVKRKIFSSK